MSASDLRGGWSAHRSALFRGYAIDLQHIHRHWTKISSYHRSYLLHNAYTSLAKPLSRELSLLPTA